MPYTGDVFEFFATVSQGGKNTMRIVHLIFESGRPVAVLEWSDAPDGLEPLVKIPLDPIFLQNAEVAPGQAMYVYNKPIVLP